MTALGSRRRFDYIWIMSNVRINSLRHPDARGRRAASARVLPILGLLLP
jgi:hypothetical protein